MINRLHQYIKDLTSGNSNYRGDCPNCNGKNTLSISKVDGNILYFCFRASCGLRGKLDAEISIDDLRTISNSMASNPFYSSNRENLEKQQKHEIWELPEYFCSPLQNRSSYNVLNRYHLINFYTRCPDLIRYDPKLDRLVFILKDHKGNVRGACGRSLSFGAYPRWLVYERIASCPFIAKSSKKSSKAVLVEDCISASCLANLVCSIAILGTSIPDNLIQYLLPYDKLYVALDADATKKSLQVQKKLNLYKSTQIIPLKKDIKYFTKDELEQLVKEL